MQIQVVQVEVTNRGKFNQAEVAYKNLTSGKLESKKIMSFTDAYKAVADAKQGDVFNVVSTKNEKTGYWDWTSVTQSAPGQEPAVALATGLSTNTPPGKTQTYATRDFETSEERAKKQVYIVRQSSLSAAVDLLTTGAKTPPAKEEVLTLAQEFVDWVFAKPQVKTEKLADMQDDIPY